MFLYICLRVSFFYSDWKSFADDSDSDDWLTKLFRDKTHYDNGVSSKQKNSLALALALALSLSLSFFLSLFLSTTLTLFHSLPLFLSFLNNEQVVLMLNQLGFKVN
jgi:uncharacterized protein YqhQ